MPTQERVAVLVHDGYQDLEFWYPVLRLREEGTPVTVVGPEHDKTYLSKLEYPVIADLGVSEAQAKDFAAVIVPGGGAAEHIAREPRMLRFIAEAAAEGAVLGATTEGVTALAAAGALAGRRVAARGEVRGELRRADAVCVDEPVVTDGRLVTAQRQRPSRILPGAVRGARHRRPIEPAHVRRSPDGRHTNRSRRHLTG
jgi:protease I